MIPSAVAAAVALAGIGATLLVAGARRVPERPTRPRQDLVALAGLRRGGRLHSQRWVLVVSSAVGLVAGATTGRWFLVLVLPVAAVGLPALLRSDGTDPAGTLSDLESWLRGLAGTLRGGSGLEQALRASRGSVPPSLAPSVARLVSRLDTGTSLPDALRLWADEHAAYTTDLVASCLILEAGRRSGRLATALEDLADTVAEAATNTRQVEADRSTPRWEVRAMTVLSLVLVGALMMFSQIAKFYTTPAGQLVAVVLIAAFAGCLIWMRSVAQGRPTPRFLDEGSAP
ncbi:MAG: type II secretion system F family protein [Cellulomonas sp.]|nr:type II secretion system F family protein [Cellulomonas sp.]